MKYAKKFTIFSIIVLFSLISSLVFPISALADDTTPPPADTPEVSQPTEAPVATESPASIEVTAVAPSATDMPVIVEPSLTAPAATQVPATEESTTNEATNDINVAEVVAQLDTANLVLLDENGQSIPLASNQAAEVLNAPDPIGCPPGVLPISWGGTGLGCTASYTSIQAAINDPLVISGWTVYVEAGVYHEQVTISKANVTLMGDPGSLTAAGAGPNAPILDGSTWASGDVRSHHQWGRRHFDWLYDPEL